MRKTIMVGMLALCSLTTACSGTVLQKRAVSDRFIASVMAPPEVPEAECVQARQWVNAPNIRPSDKEFFEKRIAECDKQRQATGSK